MPSSPISMVPSSGGVSSAWKFSFNGAAEGLFFSQKERIIVFSASRAAPPSSAQASGSAPSAGGSGVPTVQSMVMGLGSTRTGRGRVVSW